MHVTLPYKFRTRRTKFVSAQINVNVKVVTDLVVPGGIVYGNLVAHIFRSNSGVTDPTGIVSGGSVLMRTVATAGSVPP